MDQNQTIVRQKITLSGIPARLATQEIIECELKTKAARG